MVWKPHEWSDDVKIHASLLLAGWAVLIPYSVLVLAHLHRRIRKNLHIVKIAVLFHMIFGVAGVILALAGFGYGVKHLSTFNRLSLDKLENGDIFLAFHAVVGSIATAGACFQILTMALMREPEFKEDGSYKEVPLWQTVGSYSHRGFGALWLFLAFVALETGTHGSGVHGKTIYTGENVEDLNRQHEKYSVALIGCIFFTIVAVATTVQLLKCLYPEPVAQVSPETKELASGDAKSEDEMDV